MPLNWVSPSLLGPNLKTKRAKVHLDALKDRLDVYRNSEPIQLFRKVNLKQGRYEIRIKIQDLPDEVPLILGDLVNCLRSALDQTVWQLAKLRVRCPGRTQFPILDTDTEISRGLFSRWTRGVPAVAVGLIKSFQPYHGAHPADHPLSLLNLLSNIDKHRHIPVHGEIAVLDFPDAPVWLASVIGLNHSQQMVSVPLHLKSHVALKPRATLDVVVGDMGKGRTCHSEQIAEMYDFVADGVIPRFARFFEQ